MAEVQPVREFVASVVGALHDFEVLYSEPRVTPLPYVETMAIFDQVLAAHDAEVALLPGRCAPTVEEVRDAIAAAYPTTAKARAVLALFAAQPTVREAKAAAWSNGYASGFSNAMRRMSDEPNAPITPNPYRSEARHG